MRRRAFVVAGFLVILVCVAVLGLSLVRYRLHLLNSKELALGKVVAPWPEDNCTEASFALTDVGSKPIVRDTTPFSADQLAIYQLVLEQWKSNSRNVLNLSDKTEPLDRSITDCKCLKNIDIYSLKKAATSFHILPRTFERLVDAKTQLAVIKENDPHNGVKKRTPVNANMDQALKRGLFAVSEIAFDKSRTRAILSHSFVCGGLCGNGRVWLLEKKDGVWKKMERECGGWIS